MFPRWAAFICKDVAGGTTGLHGSPASSFNTFFYITLYLGAATAIVSFCSTATFLARFVYYRSSHTPGAVPAQPANPSQVPNAVPHQPAGPGHTPNAVSAQPAGPSPSSSAASDPPEGPDGIEMKDLPVSAVHTERESSQQPLLQQPAPDSSIDSSNDGNAPATAAPVPACAGAPIAAGAVAPVAAGAGVPVAAGAGAPVAAGAGAPTATHVGPINFKWIFVFDFVCLLNWGIYLTVCFLPAPFSLAHRAGEALIEPQF